MSKKSAKVVTIPFHQINQEVLAAGVLSGPIRPDQFGTSLNAVSDGYELFRVTSLRFRVFSLASGCIAGVVTSVPNTVPSSSAQIGELLESVQHNGTKETTWSRWVNVRKDTISGPFNWYHTRVGTFDVTEAAPATVCYAGTGTETLAVEWSGVMQFKDPAAIANTPAQLALVRELRVQREIEAKERLKQQVLEAMAGSRKATQLTAKTGS